MSLGVNALCSTQPPQMPQLSSNLAQNSIPTLLQAMSAAAWPYYCRCSPGSPAPINFPPPTFTPPADWPSAPSFSCDPANLCATLSAIETLLNQVAGNVSSNYALTTLLQRYELPFAVIPGAFHLGLTGQGSFPVSRLIGVGITVSQIPPGTVGLPGVPTYLRNLGWMGFSISSGMLAERRIARQQELWMPTAAAGATTFGWNLEQGVSIDVRELQAEP